MQTTLVRQETGSRTVEPSPKQEPVFKTRNPFAAPNGNGNGNGHGRALVEALVSSKIYQDYERAFGEATGLVVALRPLESWQLPHHGKRNENPFCCLMAQKSRACSACLQVQ